MILGTEEGQTVVWVAALLGDVWVTKKVEVLFKNALIGGVKNETIDSNTP